MISKFLGTGAPVAANVNLILQVVMGAALLAGALLARMKRYTAHAICQTAVLLINAVAIAWMMWPSLQYTVLPHIHTRWYLAYYMWPIAHGTWGLRGAVRHLHRSRRRNQSAAREIEVSPLEILDAF